MFRCNLQIATNVVGRQLFDVARIFHGDVVAHAGRNQNLFDAFQITRATIEVNRRFVVGVHMRADVRINARQTTAGLFRTWRLTAQHVHVGRWATQIGNHAGEARYGIANRLDLVDDRIFRTALDDASFMLGDRTERTAAKAAAHNVDGKTDHLVGRNTAVAICRVRDTFIRQREDAIHLFGRQRDRRRVNPNVAVAVFLHQGARAARVGFVVQNT